jgi:hypothetical protein
MGENASVYLVDHVVVHDGDVRRWRRFEYDSPSPESQHSGTHAPDGTVHLAGTLAPELFDAVSGYGEHLVLAQMIGDDADTVSYVQFDESEPEGDWCVDGVVVKSDWCGAQPFLVDDLDDLCGRARLGGGRADQGVCRASGRESPRSVEVGSGGSGIRGRQ